ncbi:hypothetical protein [Pendulispora albinea]|uniref:Antibiotic biosynthesis monooxygenase n=1 Tax=Pendulispora albinea TaxID=2741071 RepID=A0ABZ2LQZ2_9BACT
MSNPLSLPDLTRSDAASIITSTWRVGGRERQRAAADATMSLWDRLPWPEDCISLNCYLSTDGQLIWFLGQWTSEEAHRVFTRTQREEIARGVDGVVPNIERLGVIRSRRHTSLPRPEGVYPGCIVVVTIATDDPARQVRVAETMAAHVARPPSGTSLAGGLGAHLFFSTDGTRVLNYAEWTSERAHQEALDGGALGSKRGIFDGMAGIQGIGVDRYTLYRRLVRPAR